MSRSQKENTKLSPESALEQIASLQAELDATRATLEEERTARRLFARRLGQDFRIPLNAMLGFSQLLKSSMQEDVDSLDKVLSAGAQMLELIEEMGAEGIDAEFFEEAPKGSKRPYRNPPEGALAATPASVRPIVPGSLGGGRVLYVEDQLTNVQMVELILNRHLGVSVDAVSTGKEGIAAVRRQPPDLILLDLNLPDMHGSDVMERLGKHASTARIPVIVLSGDAAPSQIDRMLARGARDYLVKPFKMERLKEAVGAVLREVRAKGV